MRDVIYLFSFQKELLVCVFNLILQSFEQMSQKTSGSIYWRMFVTKLEAYKGTSRGAINWTLRGVFETWNTTKYIFCSYGDLINSRMMISF